MKGDQRVVHTPNGRWAVHGDGNKKNTAVYDTQNEAITRGREIARNNKVELFICGRDGRIRERNTYGKDNCPPRG